MKDKTNKSPGAFRRMPVADISLSSDIRNTILVQNPRGGQAILWLIFLFVICAIVWASVTEIDEVTRGDGKVIPSSRIQYVQNLEGGILAGSMVQVGDVVEKGQLLLKIDETRFSGPYRESRVRYLTLKARIARLQAEISDQPFLIPAEVKSERALVGAREKELFIARKEKLATTISILGEQVKQRQQEVEELKAEREKLSINYSLISRELELTRPLIADGAVSEVEILRLERQANEIKGSLTATELAIPRIKSKAEEALDEIREEVLLYKNLARADLSETSAKLEELMVTAVALQDRLTRTNICSPVHGIVNQVLVNTIGGVIQPGMDLVEIVPLDDTLLIEAKIRPRDIAFLSPNQKANVKFTAYDFTIFGGLDAKLEHISANSITDERGLSYYLVRVRTQKNYLGTDAEAMPIIPGMVTSVDILTGKKTIMSYLLKPLLRAKQKALREN